MSDWETRYTATVDNNSRNFDIVNTNNYNDSLFISK